VSESLFVVGCELSDRRIQAGTEVMGVLRGLGRDGVIVDPRVLLNATLDQVARECARFKPHLVHVIAHGGWESTTHDAVLHLQKDERAEDGRVTAADLLGAFGNPPPTVVVLSACATGSVHNSGGAPMAAQLVDGGVAIVLAMAGDIADSACRMFSRAFAAAVERGIPVVEALTLARTTPLRRDNQSPDDRAPIDWALPALFVADSTPSGYRLATPPDPGPASRVLAHFGLRGSNEPVLCAREEFFPLLYQLLDRDNPLAVLLTWSDRLDCHTGGSRLLAEFAAAAIRSGHVPCSVGNFAGGDAPTDIIMLAVEIERAIAQTRAIFDAPEQWASQLLPVLATELGIRSCPDDVPWDQIDAMSEKIRNPAADRHQPESLNDGRLARLLHLDLEHMAKDVAVSRPQQFSDTAVPLLLIDDVHHFDRAVPTVFNMLGVAGLRHTSSSKTPVVVFGKAPQNSKVRERIEQIGGQPWAAARRLLLFPDIARANDSDEDILAWRWLLLHPVPRTDGPCHVLTPRPDPRNSWHTCARNLMFGANMIFDPLALRRLSEQGRQDGNHWFNVDDDDEIMRTWVLRAHGQ
jgi:hypothetical protein